MRCKLKKKNPIEEITFKAVHSALMRPCLGRMLTWRPPKQETYFISESTLLAVSDNSSLSLEEALTSPVPLPL